MKANWLSLVLLILIPHPSSFLRRRSQVVRQRSAKPLFIGSIPIAASNSPQQCDNLASGIVICAEEKQMKWLNVSNECSPYLKNRKAGFGPASKVSGAS